MEEQLTLNEYNQILYNELVDKLENDYMEGLIDEDELIILKAQATEDLGLRLEAASHGFEDPEEYQDYVAALVEDGYFDDEIYDDYEYGYGDNLASFSEGTELGDILLDVLVDGYGTEDLESGVYDLAEATGSDEETILDLLEGNLIPDLEGTELLAEALGLDEDEDLYYGFHELAANERGESILDYFDDEDEVEDEVEEVLEYAAQVDRQTQMVQDRLDQAEFNGALSHALDALMDRAIFSLQEGYMTPKEFEVFFGNLAELSSHDRVAVFSDYCSVNETDEISMFNMFELLLEGKEQCGRVMNYVQYSAPTEREVEEAQFAAQEAKEDKMFAKYVLERI